MLRILGILCLVTANSFLMKGQDRLILLSSDTIRGKVLKVSQNMVEYSESAMTFSKELDIRFINQIILESGRAVETQVKKVRPFSSFSDGHVLILKYNSELEGKIDVQFPKAVKRVFHFNLFDGGYDVEMFGQPIEGIPYKKKKVVEAFKYTAFATNAFLVLIDIYHQAATLTFYSRSITSSQVSKVIIGKKYELVDSRGAGKLLDMVDNTLQSFTLEFLENGSCYYKNAKEESRLSYSISNNALITFKNPAKKRGSETSYEIVYLDHEIVRYTLFTAANTDMITRSIRVVR